jgi:hypothetical protein
MCVDNLNSTHAVFRSCYYFRLIQNQLLSKVIVHASVCRSRGAHFPLRLSNDNNLTFTARLCARRSPARQQNAN